MTQYQISGAYPVLQKLSSFDLPVTKARAVYHLLREVDEHYQFSVNEQKKYLSAHGGKVTENGDIQFPSPEECAAFQAKIEELMRLEVELHATGVALTDEDLGAQRIKPSYMAKLEGFIIFE